MKLSRIIRNLFVTFWVLSVLWIMIGSLVNFHQYKIWKRPLLPQVVFNKRDKEKVFTLQKFQKNNFNKDSDPVAFRSGPESPGAGIFKASRFIVRDPVSHAFHIITPAGLRAPPLS